MWQACDFDPEMGLRELIYMSLVKLEDEYEMGVRKKKFWMHDQLRDLGRKIVCESFQNGLKPSRIWMPDDALEVLREEEVKGKENVEMIRLRYHDDPAKGYPFTKRDLSRFGNLRYFRCRSRNDGWKSMMIPNKLRGRSWRKYPPLLPKLRWLEWFSFPPKFQQVEFCLSKLVILCLPWSDIDENWRGWNQFGVGSPLKVLDLCGCHRLKRIPNLSAYSNLERLNLTFCYNLGKLDPSISVMKSLLELDLSWTTVDKLPDTIGQLVKLEVLSLHHCLNVEKLPVSIGSMKSLVRLDVSWSGITELPYSVGRLVNLRVVSMNRTMIKELPSSFGMLKRLEELHASCTPLEEIPSNTIEGLTCLRVLNLQETNLYFLPPSTLLQRATNFSDLQNLVQLVLTDKEDRLRSSEVRPIKLEGIGKLRGLVELGLDLWNVTCIPEELSSLFHLHRLTLGCPNLQRRPPLPPTLSYLSLRGLGEKHHLPRLSSLTNLSTLKFSGCCIRETIVRNLGVGDLESLMSVSIFKCELGNLNGLHLPPNVRKLRIDDCKSLKALLALSHELKNLTELSIKRAQKLVEIPELGELESLTRLSLIGCEFRNLDGLHLPANLRQLYIVGCESLRALPALSRVKNLKQLTIVGAHKLVDIPELGELELLQILTIIGCGSLRGKLQNLFKLKMLRRIEIVECGKFRGIDGIRELESLEHLCISDCGCVDIIPARGQLFEETWLLKYLRPRA